MLNRLLVKIVCAHHFQSGKHHAHSDGHYILHVSFWFRISKNVTQKWFTSVFQNPATVAVCIFYYVTGNWNWFNL